MIDLARRDGPTAERSDIDIVIFLHNLTIEQHIAQLPAQLELLHQILASATPPLKDLKFRKFTRFAVRFSVEGVSVDLLPAFGLKSNQDSASQSIIIPPDRKELWPFYSKCFVKEQCDFIEEASKRNPNLKVCPFRKHERTNGIQ